MNQLGLMSCQLQSRLAIPGVFSSIILNFSCRASLIVQRSVFEHQQVKFPGETFDDRRSYEALVVFAYAIGIPTSSVIIAVLVWRRWLPNPYIRFLAVTCFPGLRFTSLRALLHQVTPAFVICQAIGHTRLCDLPISNL